LSFLPRREDSLVAELLRRRVPQTVVLWMVGSLSLAEGVSLLIESMGLPGWILQTVVVAALAGMPVAAVVAWRYDLTRGGLRRTSEELAPQPFRWTPARVAAVGLVGVVLLAAGWLTLGRDRGADHLSGRLAVLPLENSTGDPSLAAVGKIAADWITEGLVRTGFVQVVDQSTTLRVAGWEYDSTTASAPPVNAEVFVTGIYYRQGDELIFQARVARRDGTLLEALPSVRGPAGDPMAVVAVLQERVLSSLAVHFDPRLEHFEGFGGAPPRYPAYRAYVEGLELYMEDAYTEAAEAFRRAASLDTSFHRARVWNAGALFVSATAPGVLDSLDRVIELGTSRLSRYDFHHARYFRALGDPIDLREAERQAQAMMAAAPGSEDAVREAALSARRVGRYQKALELFDRLDPDRGLIARWPSYWYNVARTHLDNRNPVEALAAAQEGIRRHGRYATGFLPLAVIEIEALLALGRKEEAETLIDQAPINGLSGLYLLLKASMRAGAEGEQALEEALLGRIAERTDLLQPVRDEPLYRRWAKAWLLYYLGRYDEAAALLALPGSGTGEEEPATATTGRLYRVLTLQGLLAVQRGDTADAWQILNRLAELGGDGAALGRARIYGLLGEDDAARRALGAPGAAEFEPSSPSVSVLPELRGVL
jgi:tetratricopeptide (TPR) repeat protein